MYNNLHANLTKQQVFTIIVAFFFMEQTKLVQILTDK